MPDLAPRIYAQSRIGNTHISKSLPNQDSVRFWISPDSHHFCIAISDGHGSSSHPYSDVGSRFAAEIAIDTYQSNYVNSVSSLDPENFFKLVLERWTQECIAYHKQTYQSQDSSESPNLKLYGATLCVVYVCGDTIAVSSVGDSNVYYRNHSGLVSGFLINDDSYGEATFSLCQPNALSHLETKYIPYSPGIIVASTDGIIKSLKSSEDYALIPNYYLSLVANSQVDDAQINADITSQLDQFSKNGSGDDCTLALVLIPSSLQATEVVEIEKQGATSNQLKNIYSGLTASNNSLKKKKGSTYLLPLVLLTAAMSLLLVILTPVAYRPLRNHFLYLIRTSLCLQNPAQNIPTQLQRAKEL